ncbi:hypothetical protein THRCLA_06073, partial [Thraustotheca clavata]
IWSLMSLPLARDFFHCPALTRDEVQCLIEKAHTACKLTVRNATQFASIFTLDSIVQNDKTEREAKVYKGFDTDDGIAEVGMCAQTKLTATLEEVADLFYLDNVVKYEAYSKVTGHLVLDKQSLYTLVPKAPSGKKALHYIGIEWMVAKTPVGLKSRDFCFIEIHDEFTFFDKQTQQTRRGWVRCMHSIPMHCCLSLEKSHGFVRSHFVRSGHIFMETEHPTTLIYYNLLCGVTRRSNYTPTLAHEYVLRRHVTQLLNLEEYLTTQRLKTFLENPIDNFQQKDQVEYCNTCYHRFQWLSIKKQCRGCGDVLCNHCAVKWELPLSETVISMTVCRKCINDNHIRSFTAPNESRFRLGNNCIDLIMLINSVDTETEPCPFKLHQLTFKNAKDDLAIGKSSPMISPLVIS